MNTTKIALVFGMTMLMLGGLLFLKNPPERDTTFIQAGKNLGNSELSFLEERERADLFSEWIIKYNKKYGSKGEYYYRFKLWNKSYNIVHEHNSKGLSWELETNMFADLSDEEFAALYLGYKGDPDRIKANIKYLNESDAPEGTSWDWRKKGAVTSVKDQQSCGSCYTFASAGSLEALHFIQKGKLIDFSSQQLLDCTSSYGNQGCNGGMMVPCYKYVQEKGIMKLTDYPYQGKVTNCAYNAQQAVFKNKGYAEVPKNDFTQLRVAVKKIPVSVALAANNDAFKLYKSGIISSNCGTDLDHAIVAVGYGAGFWIVKNQWGTSWGEAGYGRIASGSQNDGKGVCGINMDNSYPT